MIVQVNLVVLPFPPMCCAAVNLESTKHFVLLGLEEKIDFDGSQTFLTLVSIY